MSALPALAAAAALLFCPTGAGAATIEITIDRLEFRPATVTARPGDTILWRNRDVMDHTATAKGKFDVVIPAGASGSAVVNADGVVEYLCRFHPNMKGRIAVGR
jgi:plastocyanin